MPIYEYSCQPCGAKWKEMHGSDDKGGKCHSCNTYAARVLPVGTTIVTTAKPSTAGQRVEKFIEESRQVLGEQMKEARQDYNP